MVSAVRTADLLIKPIADRLGCGLSHLAEELIADEGLKPFLGEAANRIHPLNEFLGLRLNVFRTIADPLDGSSNHKKGIPLFASAIALLVEDQPRVAAIFDPIHDLIYSASLSGPYDKPDRQRVATAWQINSGHAIDLVNAARQVSFGSIKSEAIAVHLPRKDQDARKKMFAKMPEMAESFETVYMLNSGIHAMALVARGGLAAFVNPWTNLHDVIPGEVLCRATGCIVTDWEGQPIQYNKAAQEGRESHSTKTSLLAARRNVYEDVFRILTT